MKRVCLTLIAALFLAGCPKRVQPKYPVITNRPPQYIWVCQQLTGFIRCDAVPSEQDVPKGYDCVIQDDGVEVCWAKQK